jgi:hypothetical protein
MKGNEFERQRRLRSLPGAELLERLGALRSRLQSGKGTPEDRTELRAIGRMELRRRREVEKRLDGKFLVTK